MRRAQIDVTVAGISLQNGNYAKCSRGVMIVPDIVPDKSFSDISNFVCNLFCLLICFRLFFIKNSNYNIFQKKENYDVIVIPGGLAGAQTISSNSEVQKLLASAHRAGKFVAAICAGI